MASNYSTTKGWTSKKGAFIGAIWHCDCNPRLPAEKFQTKNGGRNHGRWFFTCQKPKIKGCGFFLWADDAKVREEGAVLSNSHSEPRSIPNPTIRGIPQTPTKAAPVQQPTPSTRAHRRSSSSQTLDFEHEESFDWSSSGDEALAKLAAHASAGLPPAQPLCESSRKAPKTTEYPSPGKRTHATMLNDTTTTLAIQDAGEIFTTPATSNKSKAAVLVSPSPTPAAQGRSQANQTQAIKLEHSTLANEALEILRKNPTPLSPSIEQDLIELLNKHDLRTQGITSGRQISRLAVAAREKRIAQLESKIAGLELEKETQRRVISQLKSDIATSPVKASPKKPPHRGRGGRSGYRFEHEE